MQKLCLSYIKVVSPSVEVDVALRYCVFHISILIFHLLIFR